MPYTKTPWVANVTPVTAASMNNIEAGIATGPGVSLNRTEITASVGITATSAATATTIVTTASISFDGATEAMFEFYTPGAGGSTSDLTLTLWQDSTQMGIIAYMAPASSYIPVHVCRFLSPSAGSHVYSIRGYVTSGTTAAVAAGGGGAGNMPAYLRVSRA